MGSLWSYLSWGEQVGGFCSEELKVKKPERIKRLPVRPRAVFIITVITVFW